MRKFIQLVAWLLVLLAAGLLIVDLLPLLKGNALNLIAGGELWFEIDPGSLNALQAGVERKIDPWLWEAVIFPVLQFPAFVSILVLGLFLLLVSRKGRRSRRR